MVDNWIAIEIINVLYKVFIFALKSVSNAGNELFRVS